MPNDAVSLSTAIMTHPARVDSARALAERLSELDPVIVVDDDGPGRGNVGNALRAWGAVAADATHHLVLQDDVVLCEDFARQVRSAVRARPGDAVSLFCEWGSRTAGLVRAAAWQGFGWARAVDMYTPSLGLVMPRPDALAFAASADAAEARGADDLALRDFLRRIGRRSMVTVPNLLEHEDRLSLSGNGFQGLRRSACFATGVADTDFDTPVAGEGLVQLPYVSWMRVVAEWCYCGAGEGYAWIGEPIDSRLPEGLRKADLAKPFTADLADADPALAAAVSEVTLFEFWTAAFALGLTMPPTPRSQSGLFRRAFATAFPGAFRRFCSERMLTALSDPAGRLAERAFRRGVEAEVSRPDPAWYSEDR